MKKKIIAALIVSSMFLGLQAQEKVTFKLNPEKGKVVPFEMVSKSDVEGAQSMIMDMTIKMDMQATEVTTSQITYQAKYTQLKTDINAGIMTISYDSSKEPSNQMEEMMATQLKPLLESTLTIKMDKNAKITEMDFPNVPDQAFDQSSIQGMFVSYPDYPLAIGDSWNNEVSLPQLSVKGKTTSTFTEKNVDGYKITIEGIFIDNSGNAIGTTTGHYVLDAKTFFVKSSSVTSAMEIQGNKISSSTELKEIKN
ncbi:DUF6263 family protein [Sphingobacterium faecale]|uniref:GLPGLI family protein n=1 Tax=Sphingobacterium faecale TaxID=2803775 RepID=A0ABS1R4A1_9SPHI|nr:DUF6263 family protein [Sphingobacterium faecale]MBL1409546.1 hypothetical protein [Sphingobacterium faecale]